MVALFDPADDQHKRYTELLAREAGGFRLCTTWPCIVEATHLLDAAASRALLRWVARGGVQVFPFEAPQLAVMVQMMEKYSEPRRTRMDLADASLVWLAGKTRISAVMTVDVRDFSRYRLPNGRAFEII